MGNNGDKPKKVMIFMHIPKTAGSTLVSILKHQYSKVINLGSQDKTTKTLGNNSRIQEKIKTVECIRGHFLFGVHHLIDRPFTYITMLRDPVDRLISDFYYIRRQPLDPLYHVLNQMNLEEFVKSDTFKALRFQSPQTRFIAGEWHHEPDLNKAKENLSNFFSIVGITEYFDQSLYFMQKEFNWKPISYKKKNVTENRLKVDQVSDEIIERIMENNHVDIQLYQFAKHSFEKKLEKLDQKKKQDLDQFLHRVSKLKKE